MHGQPRLLHFLPAAGDVPVLAEAGAFALADETDTFAARTDVMPVVIDAEVEACNTAAAGTDDDEPDFVPSEVDDKWSSSAPGVVSGFRDSRNDNVADLMRCLITSCACWSSTEKSGSWMGQQH